ncbi:MAG: extracellular solute-binding protein [bacterium]|nr:extracellular solute-binding protein [bacterium]
MKRTKRVKAISCLVLCTAFFLAACGREGTPGNNGRVDDGAVSGEGSVFGSTQNVWEREWVYVPEVITVGDERADYGRMQPVGDSFFFVSREEETGNGAKKICRYSLTGRDLTSVPLNWPEGGNDWDVGYYFFAQDCGLYMTANVYPAGSGSMKRFLCRFDAEGSCLFSRDITGQAGRDVSLRGLTADGQERLYLFLDNGEILLYTEDGEYYGSVAYSSPEDRTPARVKGACEGADGNLYVCIGRESVNIAGENAEGTDGGRCSLLKVDFENIRLTEAAGNLPDINGLCTGTRRAGQGNDSVGQEGNFDVQGSNSAVQEDDSDVQGNNSAGQEGNSDVQGSNSAGADANLAGEYDGLDGGYDLLLYDDKAVYGYRFDTQKSDSGSAGEELLAWMDSDINGYYVANLYLLEDGRLCATVEDWLNDDRVIVALERTKAEQAPQREELVLATVDGGSGLAAMAVKFNRGNSRYHLTVREYESLSDLYNAVLAKRPLDLIDLSGVNVQRLAARGLLEDLAPYVDRSEAFDRSNFVDGILDVYTFDGLLAGIPAEFMIRTAVGNGALLNNKAGLTLEALYSLADRYPGAKAFDGMTGEEMMRFCMMFYEDSFIDWDTGVCRFDSEEFKALLEYTGRFSDSGAALAGIVSGSGEESLYAKMKRGEVLFSVKDVTPYALWDDRKLFGEDAACVGFPTADGRGGHLLIGSDAYAIAAVSEHKESAWRFIEDSLTREKSELYAQLWLTYPALKKTLEERVDAAVAGDQFTWDDVNVALKLVPDATPFFSAEDDEIIKIINEEAGAYYSGQKRVEDVADIIQNRVRVYVDENR